VSQNSDCKILCEHTEATVTCMFYVNRLLVISLTEATATSMLYRLLVASLAEAMATFMLYPLLAMTPDGRLR
jgi:hypothetical protein